MMGHPQFSGQPYMPSPEMYKSYSYGQPQMPQAPQIPTMPQPAQPAQNGGINWVQGEAAAWALCAGCVTKCAEPKRKAGDDDLRLLCCIFVLHFSPRARIGVRFDGVDARGMRGGFVILA